MDDSCGLINPFSPLAAARLLTIRSWPEALNTSGSSACLMGISRNTRSLPDFPEFAQQLGMVSPELHAASPARHTRLPRPGLAIHCREHLRDREESLRKPGNLSV